MGKKVKEFFKNPIVLLTAFALLVQTVMLVFFYKLPDPLGLSMAEMFSGKTIWQVFMMYGAILVMGALFGFAKKPRLLSVFFLFYLFLAAADYEVFRFSHQRLSYSFVRTYFHISNITDETTVSTLGGDFWGTLLFLLAVLVAMGGNVLFIVVYSLKNWREKFFVQLNYKIPATFITVGLVLSIIPLILFLTGTRGEKNIPIINTKVDMRFTLGKHTLTSPILHIVAVETFEFIRDNQKITPELVEDLNSFLPEYKKALQSNSMEFPGYFDAPTHEYKAKQPYNIVFIFGESFKGRIINQMLEGDTTLAPNLWKLSQGRYYPDSLGGALWFKNAFSGGYPTVRGTMSTYLGFPTHPNRDVPSFYASNHFKGFPEYLKGYKKACVTVSNPVFDHTLPFIERFFEGHWKLTPDSEIPGTVDSLGINLDIQQLKEMPTNRPWLLLFNTIATHIPFFNYPEAFAEKPEDPMVRYRNALRYTDQQLGRFLDSLSKRSDFKRTVVLILGDHDTPVDSVDRKIPQPIGVSSSQVFMGIFSADTNLFNGLTVREDVASQLDIGPTIMDLAGVREPNHFWGYDLLVDERPAEQPSLFFGENGYYLGFRDHVLTGGLKTEEIYHGVNQSFEQINDSLSGYWKKKAKGAGMVLRSLLRNDNMMPQNSRK